MKKVKGLRNINWMLHGSRGDVENSIGNIVNNILIAVCGVRWVQDLSGRSLGKL